MGTAVAVPPRRLWSELGARRGKMGAVIKRMPLDVSKQRFEGGPLTAPQAERLLSICVDMIDLCAEVTRKIDPAVGAVVACACEDALNGILGAKP
jgi:hypothetical protein